MQWEESGNLKQAALGGQVSNPVWDLEFLEMYYTICIMFFVFNYTNLLNEYRYFKTNFIKLIFINNMKTF